MLTVRFSALSATIGLLLLPLVLLASSCDGDDGASCTNVAGCGGDVVGSWEITGSCLKTQLTTGMSEMCGGLKAETSDGSIIGTYTFNADRTYSWQIAQRGSVTLTIPASCLQVGGTKLTCQQFGEAYASAANPGEEASCTGTSECKCVVKVSSEAVRQNGTYATAGGQLVTTSDEGATDTSEYCVRGNKLSFSPSASEDPEVMGSVLLTKK